MKIEKLIFVIIIFLIISIIGCMENNNSTDLDNDGFDNDSDFYDDGNGAIKVEITKYIDDGYIEEDGTDLDVFFYISLSVWMPDEGRWVLFENISDLEFSKVYENTSTITTPIIKTFDIDDNIEKISVAIHAFDYEGGEKSFLNSRIDLNGDDEEDYVREDIKLDSLSLVHTYFFEDDGTKDLLDEPDAYIEWSISIVGID